MGRYEQCMLPLEEVFEELLAGPTDKTRTNKLADQVYEPLTGKAVEPHPAWVEELVVEEPVVEEDLDDGPELVLDPEQADAVYVLANAPIGIITGGPGRGKTRVLQAALPHLGGSVALCAPTGKAARRMAQLTSHSASTVHRLLGLAPGGGPQYHKNNPLPFDTVVVDEASTLDVFLLQQLLDACDVRMTRVFLIGDVDQLPSVGPGQVLLDLIRSDKIPVVRLIRMHRAAADSWVCRMAPEILKGRIDLSPADNFQFVESDTELLEDTIDVMQQLVERYGREEVQCIVPMNVGPYGTIVLNEVLQAHLNPGETDAPNFSAGKTRIRKGDDVVAISNDYDHAVFNGETGRVVALYRDGANEIEVDFGDRTVVYKRAEASENLRLAYALSVHKMQGSEVGYVVLVMHESHGPLLSRKLLYTAVTRARHGVVIVGQHSAVMRAVRTEDSTRRSTLLSERLLASPDAGD